MKCDKVKTSCTSSSDKLNRGQES